MIICSKHPVPLDDKQRRHRRSLRSEHTPLVLPHIPVLDVLFRQPLLPLNSKQPKPKRKKTRPVFTLPRLRLQLLPERRPSSCTHVNPPPLPLTFHVFRGPILHPPIQISLRNRTVHFPLDSARRYPVHHFSMVLSDETKEVRIYP